MVEDDINQMFPSNKVGILAAALRDDQSSCVLGLGRAFTVVGLPSSSSHLR
jgi:hypothetical protein